MELERLTSSLLNNDEGTICCICLDSTNDVAVESNTWIDMDCCKQSIHKECLLKWIVCDKSNGLCPICRRYVSLKNYVTLEELLQTINTVTVNAQYINGILKKDYNITWVFVPEVRDETDVAPHRTFRSCAVHSVKVIIGFFVLLAGVIALQHFAKIIENAPANREVNG